MSAAGSATGPGENPTGALPAADRAWPAFENPSPNPAARISAPFVMTGPSRWRQTVRAVEAFLCPTGSATRPPRPSVGPPTSGCAHQLNTEDLLGDQRSELAAGENVEGPLNFLVLGVDEQGEGRRSDSRILVHVSADLDEVAEAADALWAAIADGSLAEWIAAHPGHVSGGVVDDLVVE